MKWDNEKIFKVGWGRHFGEYKFTKVGQVSDGVQGDRRPFFYLSSVARKGEEITLPSHFD